ncbi:MAG: hypothetical protein HN416_13575 [Nitrospina sp.]|jgi:hypothetical protein|nr:hypothetical protein [Nitrospina sp.]
MIDPRDIVGLVNLHVSKVLTVAEAALPESQFKAFRKLVLDEFGRNGLETEVYDLINKHRGSRVG